jgi:hypothetical protein
MPASDTVAIVYGVVKSGINLGWVKTRNIFVDILRGVEEFASMVLLKKTVSKRQLSTNSTG